MQMHSPTCFASTVYRPILVTLALFSPPCVFIFLSPQSDTQPVVSSLPHLVLFNTLLSTSPMLFPVLLMFLASWGCITQLLAASESQVSSPSTAWKPAIILLVG